jgi:HD-GYP domain-containing protein (c-di-GMP phosphodiesterase class II)
MRTMPIEPNIRSEPPAALSMRLQGLGVVAFAGDLSMGQPVDHSTRTAMLALRVLEACGLRAADRAAYAAAQVGLLRWAGCTANAREFAELFGDDIAGRANLLADRNPFVARPMPAAPLTDVLLPLATAHCEAGIEIARRFGLSGAVQEALGDLFELWDGSGFPAHKRGEQIHPAAQAVSLAGDLEVLARVYGGPKALALIEGRAGSRYDPALARLVVRDGLGWLDRLRGADAWSAAAAACDEEMPGGLDALDAASLAQILSDFADLKVPLTTGFARRVAEVCEAAAAALGFERPQSDELGSAALLHVLGRVAVPNATLERTEALGEADREALRLAPHWTERALRRAPALAAPARLAAQAYERLDGSGYHRGLASAQLGRPARLLQAAVVAVALTSERPWRDALAPRAAERELQADIDRGRLDAQCVAAVLAACASEGQATEPRRVQTLLTPRETEVLRALAHGHSNKQIARLLAMSPRTAGTHVESIYRKLGVSTRAAAALRAIDLGVLLA